MIKVKSESYTLIKDRKNRDFSKMTIRDVMRELSNARSERRYLAYCNVRSSHAGLGSIDTSDIDKDIKFWSNMLDKFDRTESNIVRESGEHFHNGWEYWTMPEDYKGPWTATQYTKKVRGVLFTIYPPQSVPMDDDVESWEGDVVIDDPELGVTREDVQEGYYSGFSSFEAIERFFQSMIEDLEDDMKSVTENSNMKKSYTDMLLSDSNFELVLWDDVDSNRIIHVDDIDRHENGKIYKAHVVFSDTVNDEHYDQWMSPNEINDLVKDNMKTIKVESSNVLGRGLEDLLADSGYELVNVISGDETVEENPTNATLGDTVGKTAWQKLYPHVVEIAHDMELDPNDVVIAIKDWLNKH